MAVFQPFTFNIYLTVYKTINKCYIETHVWGTFKKPHTSIIKIRVVVLMLCGLSFLADNLSVSMVNSVFAC